MIEAIQLMALVGIVASAAVCLKSRDLLVSVILLGAMSLLLSAEFYILQAPDVAIAEAAIGAGFATAVYVMAINKTRRWENERED
jgi:energy-converting hydrogenase B subunit D